MPGATGPSRRYVLLLVLVSAFISIVFVTSFRRQPEGVRHPNAKTAPIPAHHVDLQASTLTGHVIAPKLGNETAK